MWLVHMCVPTTPPCSHVSPLCSKNQTREVCTRCQKNSDECQGKHKPGGSNQASRPEILREITKPPSLEQKRLSLILCKKATEDCHRSRPAGRLLLGRPGPPVDHSLAPLRVLTVCHSYSMFLPGFVQFHSKSCQLKSNKIFE